MVQWVGSLLCTQMIRVWLLAAYMFQALPGMIPKHWGRSKLWELPCIATKQEKQHKLTKRALKCLELSPWPLRSFLLVLSRWPWVACLPGMRACSNRFSCGACLGPQSDCGACTLDWCSLWLALFAVLFWGHTWRRSGASHGTWGPRGMYWGLNPNLWNVELAHESFELSPCSQTLTFTWFMFVNLLGSQWGSHTLLEFALPGMEALAHLLSWGACQDAFFVMLTGLWLWCPWKLLDSTFQGRLWGPLCYSFGP